MSLYTDAVALYLCNDGSGSQLTDSTANANHGTLQGSAGWATIGGEACLDVTGADGDYVSLGDLTGMDGAAFSIMFRARVLTTLVSNGAIVDKWLTTSDQRSWRIHTQTDGRITADVSSDGTTGANRYFNVPSATGYITTTEWNNFVVTFNAGTISVYKNDGTPVTDTDSVTSAVNNNISIHIGNGHVAPNGNIYIRNVVLLSTVATAQQITDHHNESFGIPSITSVSTDDNVPLTENPWQILGSGFGAD